MDPIDKKVRIDIIKEKARNDKMMEKEKIKARWENLATFIIPSDVPNIPRVDENEYRNFYIPKLIKAGGITKADLIDGGYYIGDHRRAKIAIWNEKENHFIYNRYKFGQMFKDTCNHFEDDDGFALFVPIRIATKEEFDEI
jgi:hypothetical protein